MRFKGMFMRFEFIWPINFGYPDRWLAEWIKRLLLLAYRLFTIGSRFWLTVRTVAKSIQIVWITTTCCGVRLFYVLDRKHNSDMLLRLLLVCSLLCTLTTAFTSCKHYSCSTAQCKTIHRLKKQHRACGFKLCRYYQLFHQPHGCYL